MEPAGLSSQQRRDLAPIPPAAAHLCDWETGQAVSAMHKEGEGSNLFPREWRLHSTEDIPRSRRKRTEVCSVAAGVCRFFPCFLVLEISKERQGHFSEGKHIRSPGDRGGIQTRVYSGPSG